MHPARLAVQVRLVVQRSQQLVHAPRCNAYVLSCNTELLDLIQILAEAHPTRAARRQDLARRHVRKAVCQAHVGQPVLGTHAQHLDVVDALDETFQVQEADHQRLELPRRAHQRDQLAIVDEDREANLADDVRVDCLGPPPDVPHVAARNDRRELFGA